MFSCPSNQKKVLCKSKHRWLCAQNLYKLRQTKLSQYVYFSLVLRKRQETKTRYPASYIWLARRTIKTLITLFFLKKKTPDCDDCPNQGNAGFWVVQKPKAKKSILPILTVLKEMVNVELFVDAKFVLFGLSVFFGILGLYIPYAYLPSLAVDCLAEYGQTLSKERANFLLSIIGKCRFRSKLELQFRHSK